LTIYYELFHLVLHSHSKSTSQVHRQGSALVFVNLFSVVGSILKNLTYNAYIILWVFFSPNNTSQTPPQANIYIVLTRILNRYIIFQMKYIP
jgi:hypothetical protein